jgi:DNA (cytosine-5)-methyltransferase 1
VFDGIIGGPPCQKFGGLANFAHLWKIQPENLVPEYERCVAAAAPTWFLMENVRNAPIPSVAGYLVRDELINNRWLGQVQSRVRRFSFGSRDGRRLHVETEVFEPRAFSQSVTAAHAGQRRTHAKRTGGTITNYTLAQALQLQGLPPDFFGPKSPFKEHAKLKAVAEGVPLPMGRAIARAVRRAIEKPGHSLVSSTENQAIAWESGVMS